MSFWKASLIICVTSAFLAACEPPARDDGAWTLVRDNGGISLSTALRDCNAQARAASAQASAAATYGAVSGGGFAGGFANSLNQSLAGPLASRTALNNCMSVYGFEKR